MKVRWSPTSASDLEAIFEYIRIDKEGAAKRTIRGLIRAGNSLCVFPHRGRPGEHEGTRELIHGSYRIVYRVIEDLVSIETILHGAQKS
jgi:toxin ParE1/3/4